MFDEEFNRKALAETVRQLREYESKFVEDSFFTAAEIFIGTNLSQEERKLSIKEILETFESVKKQLL